MSTTKTQLKSLVQSARAERRKIMGQLAWLDRVIAKYTKLEKPAVSVAPSKGKRRTGWTWSAAAKKKQSKSMKASWAKRKQSVN